MTCRTHTSSSSPISRRKGSRPLECTELRDPLHVSDAPRARHGPCPCPVANEPVGCNRPPPPPPPPPPRSFSWGSVLASHGPKTRGVKTYPSLQEKAGNGDGYATMLEEYMPPQRPHSVVITQRIRGVSSGFLQDDLPQCHATSFPPRAHISPSFHPATLYFEKEHAGYSPRYHTGGIPG